MVRVKELKLRNTVLEGKTTKIKIRNVGKLKNLLRIEEVKEGEERTKNILIHTAANSRGFFR